MTFQKHDQVVRRVRMSRRRICDERAGVRGQVVGPAQGQTGHELREVEPGIEVLQRRQHLGQGS